jgi:putative ABC transport system permease protein
VSAFLFDFRDALRGLRRDHLYSATVVATLALTIGAAAAVFSIVDGVLLKPLQYRDPGRLVILKEIWREASRQGASCACRRRPAAR